MTTTLNLANKQKSNIDFEVINFPDGQSDIRLVIDTHLRKWEDVKIISRFNSFKDLEIIIAAKAALCREEVTSVSLYVPYVLGARSDRKFVLGGTSYLVDVVAPILNAQGFTKITALDIHSDVGPAVITGLTSGSNIHFILWALQQIENNWGKTLGHANIVSPDAGAAKKIYGLIDEILYTKKLKDEIPVKLITANKHRDMVTGKILSTEVPVPQDAWGRDFIIIDDICDGGRTFIEIAKVLKSNPQFETSKIYLMVTHGIFSAGYAELNKYFDGIFTTDSVKEIGYSQYDGYHDKPTGVTQYELFN